VGTTLAVLACVATLAWMQFSFDGLLDGDSYFHTRAAQQLFEHGVQREFPQAGFSTWKERYSDKDLLFHVLLIPFCASQDALIRGGKLAVVFFDLLLLASLGVAIRGLGIRFGPLWILMFFSANAWLLRHLLVVRPHLLALSLIQLEVLALLAGRWKTLALLSALHVLSHSSYVLLPAFPLALALARLIRRERMPWRELLGVAAGLLLATFLHPQFPNNLTVTYDQVIGVSGSLWTEAAEIPEDLFGRELRGLSPALLARTSPGWMAALLGVAFLLARRPLRALRASSLTLCFLTLGFALLTVLSQRFFAFLIPLATLLAGDVWTELAGTHSWRDIGRRGAAGFRWAAAFLASCIAVGQLEANAPAVREAVRRAPGPVLYRAAIEHLDAVAGEDDLVYHAFWRPFAGLYHFRPAGRYMGGLDPIFLYRADPERFGKMLEVYRGTASDPHAIVAGDFGARWVFVTRHPRSQPMRELLAGEPRFRRSYGDRYAEVYEVLGVPARSHGGAGR
jgi:hypothetical protein